MLEDAGSRRWSCGLDAGARPGPVCLDERRDRAENLLASPGACRSNLAYVIYTSGSTGSPRGWWSPTAPLVQPAREYARPADVPATDAFLQMTSISFDVSLLEIFGAAAERRRGRCSPGRAASWTRRTWSR